MNIFGHHHHHREEERSGRYPPPPQGSSSTPSSWDALHGQPTVRIFTKADESFSLSVRYGEVVLAPTNPRDPYQHWIKDMRFSTSVKDEEGFPAFAMINKTTGQAIKHSLGKTHPVRLVAYNPDYLDESVLWTESGDTGEGFRCIRMVNHIGLNFDAFHGDADHDGVRDGTAVVLWEWAKGKNQRWKIVPQPQLPPPPPEHSPAPESFYAGGGGSPIWDALNRQLTVRVFTKAEESFSLAVRGGEVVLVPNNPHDPNQHWIKDMRHSTRVKDEEGFPAFALINKATGQAIKHSLGKTHPVRLIMYNPDYLDESVLWTESRDTGEGFRCIRMANNIELNFDAFHGDADHGGVRDGTSVVLWEWAKGKNQRWKIVPQ